MAKGNEGSAELPERLRFAGFTFDLAGHTLVDAGGQDVPLRRSEFALLLALVRRAGRVQSRDQLLEAVGRCSQEAFDRSIDVLIGRLRKKIEPDPKSPRLILTVAGIGYKLAARVQTVQDDVGPELAKPEGDRPAWPRSPERRQLTVMLCGFATSLPGRLDPEDLHGVVTTFHKACTDVITRCGGVVAQVRNDGILAYFGYPQAHEHDAEHAVRAGLAVIETTAKPDTGLAALLAVRVGIATGNVVVGDLLGSEAAGAHAVLGQAPDLAARLLLAAAPGSAVIATDTRRLVGGLFDCRALDPVAQDGVGEPVEAFQVIDEATVESRFEALHESGLSRLVGRAEQVALLLRRWARAREGAGRVVHISGEPGMGKSRLVHELRARLDEADRVINSFCAPHHQNTPLHPVIAHLERAAGFARDDAPDEKLTKLEALLKPSNPGEGDLTLIADLLSVPTGDRYPRIGLSPRQRRERTSQALIAQLLSVAREQPLLFVFEDLHWTDPTSRELLETLVERISNQKLLVVATSRPEFVSTWPSHIPAETVVLHRLEDGEVAEMVEAVGNFRLPAEVARRVIKRSDGVPLFVEELTKTALEDGSLALPMTLHGSLMARLDRLPAAKRAAQLGAAVGRSFSHELIAAITDGWVEQLGPALEALVASGLATRRGIAPEATYTFKHALVQDAAYESLLRSDRAAIHRRIVGALVAQKPAIEDANPELIARHCEQAGLATRAIDYYTQAGWRSNDRAAYKEARDHFGNALRLIFMLPEDDARDQAELRVLGGLAITEQYSKSYACTAHGRVVAREAELCARLGHPESFLRCAFDNWHYFVNRAELPNALRAAESLSDWGKQRGDIRGQVLGLLSAGFTWAMRGDLGAARSSLKRAIGLYEFCSDDCSVVWDRTVTPRSTAQQFLSFVTCLSGYPDQGTTLMAAGLEQAEIGGFSGLLIQYKRICLRTASFLLDPADLAGRAEDLSALSREHGLVQVGAFAAILKGYAIARSGDPKTGRVMILDGLAAYIATEAVQWSCYYRALLAETHQQLGDLHEARQLLTDTLASTERTGERWYAAELFRRLGEVHRTQGERAAAEGRFKQALAVASSQGAKLWELQAATSYARLLRDQDKSVEAHALLAPVYAWFTEGFTTVPLREAKALLDQLNPSNT